MAGTHRRVLASLLSGLVAAGLLACAGPGAPAGAAPPQARGARALPDSLLARVGSRREITLSKFQNAWAQLTPPDRPDSLTPETAREFLQLLIGKEALAELALREPWVWTADESAAYLALRDHLVLSAVLDSALDVERRRITAAGDTVPNLGLLGVMARDRLIGRLDLTFDAALLETLARAFAAIPRPSRDSSLTSQLRALGTMPQVADSLLPRAVATGSGPRYTVAELLDAWRHTNPLSRPRVDRADQVRDLACNGIFERVLRKDGAARRLAERADIAQALATRREYFAVTHFVSREVYAKIPTDSVTLERHYREHIDDWSLPLRVRLIRLVLGSRAAATQMRLALGDEARAESLATRGARAGAEYRAIVTAESDSALFARSLAAGTSAVLGPDSLRDGWAVARVTEILPPKRRTFHEARQMVYHDWTGHEGERRMEELIGRARKATRVTVNEPALAALRPAALTPAASGH
jgi:hypothetical protein